MGAATVTPESMVKAEVEALALKVLVPEFMKRTVAKSVPEVAMLPRMLWVPPSKSMVPELSVKLARFR